MSLLDEDEALAALCDPSISLRAYAKIIDQKTGNENLFNPFALPNYVGMSARRIHPDMIMSVLQTTGIVQNTSTVVST